MFTLEQDITSFVAITDIHAGKDGVNKEYRKLYPLFLKSNMFPQIYTELNIGYIPMVKLDT